MSEQGVMYNIRSLLAVLTLCAGVTFAGDAGATTYNLSSDWSNSNNPNGPWTLRGDNTVLPFSTANPVGQDAWAPSSNAGNFLPAWWLATSAGSDWLTGDVLVHAPDVGNGPGYANANVLFTAPVSGTADIFVELWNARNLGRSQSAQLFVNNVLSASFILPGNITRSSPLTASLFSVLLAAGDIVMLSLYPTISGSFGDFVGTDFTVNLTPSAVPLPAALPLFATGLGVMGLLGWRRKRKAVTA